MLRPRPSPCASCPFRCDVPSGVWSAQEYEALRDYDGGADEQASSRHGLFVFMCHQGDDHLCSGWVGHRDPHELIALRIGVAMGRVVRDVFSYSTSVRLFATGAAACKHGKIRITRPGAKAREMVEKIMKVRAARGEPVTFR